MKLVTELKTGILPRDFKQGQIGVITAWPTKEYIGRIVIRTKTDIIAVGSVGYTGETEIWMDVYNKPKNSVPWMTDGDALIQVLPPGTQLEVT